MTSGWISTLGVVLGAFLGGGIVKAFVDFLRDRRTGELEQSAFEFKTLTEMNDRLRAELKELRTEVAEERRHRLTELEEERRRRRVVEDSLAEERRRSTSLEIRVAELEQAQSKRGNADDR